MKCSCCQHENSSALKFCGECGSNLSPDTTKIRLASPESHTPKHLEERILTSKSALEAERRQLTVLFCDLEGSTALAQKLDPEQLRDLMQAYQRACKMSLCAMRGTSLST